MRTLSSLAFAVTVVVRVAAIEHTDVTRSAQARPSPQPREAIAAILDAARAHDVVALPHGHSRQSHELLRALVRAPGFTDLVNDIVVEFGNARFQDVVDRYVRGDAVTLAQVQPAWQNAVAPNNIWTDEAFFEAVRAVNAGRSRDRQVRILLGDSPIDWASVKTRDDHYPWLAMRDSFPAALIQTEVLAKRRKALVVYGHFHFQRRQVMANYDMSDWRMQTLVSLIERSTPAKMFTVWGIDDAIVELVPGITSWKAPAIAPVRGTTLGAADFGALVPGRQRMMVKGDALVPLPKEQWTTFPVEDQVDAVLYLGPQASLVDNPIPVRACAEPGFLEERLRRMALNRLPALEVERLKTICSGGSPK